jgi:hypothetical protein
MAIRRQPKEPPSQTRISVQDTYDASTPQGTAQINEEFRRIQLGVNTMADKIDSIDPKVASIEKAITPPVGGRGGDSPLYNYVNNVFNSGILEKGEKGDSGISGQNGKDGFVADYFGIEVQTDLTDLSAVYPDYKTNKINFVNPSGDLPLTYIETPIHFSGSMASDEALWQLHTGANDTRYRANINAVAYVDLSGITDTIETWMSGYDFSGVLSGFIESGIYISGLDAGGIEVQINSSDIPGWQVPYKISKVDFIDGTNLPDDYVISEVIWSGEIVDDTVLWQAATGGSDSRYSSEIKGFVFVDMSGIKSGVDTYISGNNWSGYFSGALLSGEKGDKGWIWYFTKVESDIPQYFLFDCNRPDDLWAPGTGNVTRGSGDIYVDSSYSGNINRLDIQGNPNYVGQLGYDGWSGYHGKISPWDSHSGWITPSGFPVSQLSHVGNWFANVIIGHTLSDYDLTFWRYGIGGTETLIDYIWIPPLPVDITHSGYDYSYRWHYKQHQVEKKFNCEHWNKYDRLVVKIGIRNDKDDHDTEASPPALTTGGVMRNYPQYDAGDNSVPPEHLSYPALYEDNTVYDPDQILTTYEPSHIRMPIPEAWLGGDGNLGITTWHWQQPNNRHLVSGIPPLNEDSEPYKVDSLEWKDAALPVTPSPLLDVYIKYFPHSEIELITPTSTPSYRTVIESSGYFTRGVIEDVIYDSARHGITSLHNEQLISGSFPGTDVAQHTVTLNWQDIKDETGLPTVPVAINFYHNIEDEPYAGYQNDVDPEFRVTTWASGHIFKQDIFDVIAGGTEEEVDPFFHAWDKAAHDIVVTASGFDGNLTSGDTNVQLCMQKLDDLSFAKPDLVNVETITGTKTLAVTDKTFQYINSAASNIVNLPNAGMTEGKRFHILNTMTFTSTNYLEIQFNGVSYSHKLYPNASIDVVFNGATWQYTDENYGYNVIIGKTATGYGFSTTIGYGATGGNSSVAYGTYSTGEDYSAAFGYGAIASNYNTALGNYARANELKMAVALGYKTVSQRQGEFAICADGVDPNKKIRSQVSWYGNTTNATQTELFLGGEASVRCVLLPKSAIKFNIDVIALKSNGTQGASYRIEGIIRRDNVDNVVFVGTPTIFIIGEDDPTWSAIVEADATNKALVVKATGVAGTTITWHAAGYFTEARL